MQLQQSEAEAALRLPIHHEHVLVVPCYDESPETVHRLLRHCPLDALVILVVNRSAQSPWCVKASNEALVQSLFGQWERHYVDANVALVTGNDRMNDVLIIDRTSDERVINSGVGGARQIGCDLAAELILHQRIRSRWIVNTDADTVLPVDLFDSFDKVYDQGGSALALRVVRSFSDDPDLQVFADLHDIANHMAVLGMQRAHAPWSMMVGGPGVAVSVEAYIQSGGVPAYKRAEDGHLINIAAKQGFTYRIHGQPVLTEARPVSRPPVGFGTTIAGCVGAAKEGKSFVCAGPVFWNVVAAFYHAIEVCLLGKTTIQDGTEVAVKQFDCQEHESIVLDTIQTWIGPIDAMRACSSAASIYESVHTDLDLRRSRKAHKCIGDALERSGVKVNIPITEAIEVNDWSGAKGSANISEAVDRVFATEARDCADPTGPYAWSDRLFS